MGSSVKSATNAITDAARDTRNEVQRSYRKAVSPGLREEINRTAAVVMPTAYAGNAVAVGAGENGGDLMAGVNEVAGDLGIGQTVPVADPGMGATPAEVADPQQKRRRQLAGRAGTLLTGGGTGGGTNLGGTGGRSTLLGL